MIKIIAINLSFSIVILLLLGVVCINSSGIPIGEMAAQWSWCTKTSLLFALCVVSLLIDYKDWNIRRSFYPIVIGCFIILGGIEAVWGLRQIYGIDTVLTKEPKVQSTAVREMRKEVKKLSASAQ